MKGSYVTRTEREVIARTIREYARPSLAGARIPNPKDPGHWLASTLSEAEIARLLASPDFRKGWDACQLAYAARLNGLMFPK